MRKIRKNNIESINKQAKYLESLIFSPAGDPEDIALEIIDFLGSTIKGGTLGPPPFLNSGPSLSLTDGQIIWGIAKIYKKGPITGAKFWQQTQGNYTADNNNKIGLYTYDGAGVLTKVAETANNGDLWKGTAASTQTVPFTATYDANIGLYFTATIYNQSAQTTAPTIGTTLSSGLSGIVGFDFSNNAKTFGTTNGADLPDTQNMSGITGANSRPFIALY
jgi:hypothetical protein